MVIERSSEGSILHNLRVWFKRGSAWMKRPVSGPYMVPFMPQPLAARAVAKFGQMNEKIFAFFKQHIGDLIEAVVADRGILARRCRLT